MLEPEDDAVKTTVQINCTVVFCCYVHPASVAAVPLSAAMISALSMFMAVFMMIAFDIRVILKLFFQKGFHGPIRTSGHATVQLDSRFSQGVLCTCADAAADQHLNTAIR